MSLYDALGARDLIAIKHRHGACSWEAHSQVDGGTDHNQTITWCEIATVVMATVEIFKVLWRSVINKWVLPGYEGQKTSNKVTPELRSER